ncbi:MAG: glycosyltransferase family 4 protein [Bacteroides sp.]|nr:glycosyltransferase family 4 protein [Roseburia sp.]MCM1346458.1 glycosyltransferase family 4 protein [Bacteroides sp.]MCM1421031.1 glycosyltransferase family 4 protein [Bacteroides sp.]
MKNLCIFCVLESKNLYICKMRIAYDAKRLFNNFTGLGNYSRTTIDILSENFPENEYRLFTPKVKRNEVTEPFLGNKSCVVVEPPKGMPGSVWRTFSEIYDIARESTDIFHGLSHEIPFGLRARGVPSVVTMHDVAFKTFKKMYHWHDRIIYDAKFRYSCRNADHIIAISECTKRDVMRFYNIPEERVSVVYQPVHRMFYSRMGRDEAYRHLAAARFSQPLPSDFMLYAGSINSRKNLLGIVKAMELLPEDIRLPLVIVGNGREYKREVLGYIASHGMERWFVWPQERVSDKALHALYTLARVFVYPSFYEGFGLPVVEAMLSGCPVVTSNVSSLPEAGGPSSLFVSPDSTEEISIALSVAISDDGKRASMIAGGLEYAARMFEPSVIAAQLMKIYHTTIENFSYGKL